MPFDDSMVSGLTAVVRGRDLVVSWSGVLPAGSLWQVYVDGALASTGVANPVILPLPGRDRGSVSVGAVPAVETLNRVAGAPAGGGESVTLSWYGGRYLSESLTTFRVYQGLEPGAPAPTEGTPNGTVTAFPGGVINDGAGIGPAGVGGAGRSALLYRWTSDRIGSGAWSFAVVPVDAAGNGGTPLLFTATVTAPPMPPGRGVDGRRLRGIYDPASHTATLTWLAPA